MILQRHTGNEKDRGGEEEGRKEVRTKKRGKRGGGKGRLEPHPNWLLASQLQKPPWRQTTEINGSKTGALQVPEERTEV